RKKVPALSWRNQIAVARDSPAAGTRWTMRIFPVLFWILLKGSFHGLVALELTGPRAVSGLRGSSVSVPCQYDEGYQEIPKYWCSGIIWQSCSKAVETTGSEAEVKRDRVSIRDNHTLRLFTVTMENLTLGDTGIYWCGINLRSMSDFNSPVSMTVLQDFPPPPAAPKTETSPPTQPSNNFSSGPELDSRRYQFSNHFIPLLLLGFLKTSIFLCLVCAAVWVSAQNKRNSRNLVPHGHDHDLPHSESRNEPEPAEVSRP
ncbi:CD300 molecule like family member b, partial [Chelydra serpentina]